MKQKELFTSSVLLQNRKKQYNDLQQEKQHAFTEYEKRKVREIEQKIFKELFPSNEQTPYPDSFQPCVTFDERTASSDTTAVKENPKSIISSTSIIVESNRKTASYVDGYPSSFNLDEKFTRNLNCSRFDIQTKLEKEAFEYSGAMADSSVVSPSNAENKVFSFIVCFFIITVGIRGWYELSSNVLPAFIMVGLNFFALYFTFFSVKTDVDGKVNAWVDSARIKRHYKELLKQDCKKSTRRRLWSIVGLLAIIFVVGSYYGLFDLFNDLLTILALAVSISSSWIVQKWACHIETLAQNNRPIK